MFRVAPRKHYWESPEHLSSALPAPCWDSRNLRSPPAGGAALWLSSLCIPPMTLLLVSTSLTCHHSAPGGGYWCAANTANLRGPAEMEPNRSPSPSPKILLSPLPLAGTGQPSRVEMESQDTMETSVFASRRVLPQWNCPKSKWVSFLVICVCLVVSYINCIEHLLCARYGTQYFTWIMSHSSFITI